MFFCFWTYKFCHRVMTYHSVPVELFNVNVLIRFGKNDKVSFFPGKKTPKHRDVILKSIKTIVLVHQENLFGKESFIFKCCFPEILAKSCTRYLFTFKIKYIKVNSWTWKQSNEHNNSWVSMVGSHFFPIFFLWPSPPCNVMTLRHINETLNLYKRRIV